jgi:hypothetical protein
MEPFRDLAIQSLSERKKSALQWQPASTDDVFAPEPYIMKTYLIALLLIGAAVTAVNAQTHKQTFTAPVTHPKHHVRPAPPISQKAEVDGVIPRGIRGGNFLQMFNPKAPAKYGTSQEAVSYDQNDPYRWRGIKFFEFRF